MVGCSLRCLRSFSPLLVDLEDGGAVLRLLNRPSSFLLVSLMVCCPSHVRECSAQYVVVVVKGPRLLARLRFCSIALPQAPLIRKPPELQFEFCQF